MTLRLTLPPELESRLQTEAARREEPIIATTNVSHLARFAPAQIWSTITS